MKPLPMLPIVAAISMINVSAAFGQSAMLEGSASYDDPRAVEYSGAVQPPTAESIPTSNLTPISPALDAGRSGTAVSLPPQQMPISPAVGSAYRNTMPAAAPLRTNTFSGKTVQQAQTTPFTQERPTIRAKLPNKNPQNGGIASSSTGAKTDNRTFWQRHPMVKGAAIGGGVGAGAGALTGLISGQGILRGAVIGAGTGAGVGVIRTSKIMQRHPIARDVATGAATGLGLGWAGSRYPRTIAATTGIGAAIGLGTGLFTQLH